MARKSGAAAVALAVVFAVAVVAPPPAARAAMSCSDVYGQLMPCVGYVQQGGMVPPDCCSGIRTLASAANNTPDRRTVCGCLKNVANGVTGGSYVTRAAALPSKCNVKLPYEISPRVNCNTIR